MKDITFKEQPLFMKIMMIILAVMTVLMILYTPFIIGEAQGYKAKWEKYRSTDVIYIREVRDTCIGNKAH